MIQISISPIPSQDFTCVLADQYCRVWLYQRESYLYMDLWVGLKTVCRGAVCQYGADVLQSRSIDFKGTLHFYDFLGKSKPHYLGLGSRWPLLYVPEGDPLPAYFQH
jgi:hypothetical protein